jgi:tripartite-type tricarboxylate transporter receptor subunit TctC
MRVLCRLAGFCAAAFLITIAMPLAPASAQTWPQRAVKFILPLGPGSGADINARLFADRLSKRWGQPVVVENRPGADGIVAITAFISAADDHVLFFGPTSSFTAHPFLHERLTYDQRDLAPIARISYTIVTVAVPPSINSVKDLFARAKAEPGRLNWATVTGVTDFIVAGYLKNVGLEMSKVPYRDTVQALNDLSEGRIHLYIAALAIVRAQAEAKRIKLIAITNRERATERPDLPTVTEAGYPELEFDGLVGLFGPRNMAEEVRARIVDDIRAVAADPEITSRLGATGQVVRPGTGPELTAAINDQAGRVETFARALGIARKN